MVPSASFNPRLLAVRQGRSGQVGYLRLNDFGEPVRIGPLDSFAYKLVQSLFSPSNQRATRFTPVEQTAERTYVNMLDLQPTTELGPRERGEREAAVLRTMRNLHRTKAGKHISFVQSPRGITMAISPLAR